MGGDDSQKLLPWRGIHSSPGRKPPAQLRINNVTETAGWNLARGTPSFWPRPQVQTAWVTFGKQRRVNSAARRSADLRQRGEGQGLLRLPLTVRAEDGQHSGDDAQHGVHEGRHWAGGAAAAATAAGDGCHRGVCGTGQLRDASGDELPAEHDGVLNTSQCKLLNLKAIWRIGVKAPHLV